jgi:ribosomal protein S18 acetylase RimI-like enzyme
MSGEVSVRRADANDVAVLADIGQASFRAAYQDWSEPGDLEVHLQEHFSEAAVRDALRIPGCQYLLASNDGAPAGFVKIRDGERPEQLPEGNVLELAQAYVHPDQQRFGIGGKLLAAAFDHAREQAADGVWLSVWEDAPWAVNCYLKYGFTQIGMIDFQLGKSTYNDLLMWFPLKD